MKQKEIRIFFALLISLAMAVALNNTVFYANSPNINSAFIARLENIPNYLINVPQRMMTMVTTSQITNQQKPVAIPTEIFTAPTNVPTQVVVKQNQGLPRAKASAVPQITVQPTVTQPTITTAVAQPSLVYKLITTGVYAAEDPLTHVQYVTIKSGTQVETRDYTLTLSDGTTKQIHIIIPVSQ